MVKISKKYIPKETEKYMCVKHLAYFKQKLLEWKRDIKRTNNEAIHNASMDDNSASADIIDQASSYTEKNVEMRAINRQIKLISETCLIDDKIFISTSPKLIDINNPLAHVEGVLNAIKIETDHLKSLFIEGEGAGGKATASSVISDLLEISKRLNVKKEEVVSMNRRLLGKEKSLNDPIKDEDGTEWQDWIVDDKTDQELKLSHDQEFSQRKKLMDDSMDILNPREKDILTARRLSENIATLEDLSKKYKISRERIRQIEMKAFEKLQKAMLTTTKSKNLLPKN